MKRFRVFHLFVLLSFVVTCMVATVSFAQEKVITLRYSTFFPVSHQNAVLSDQWCKEVEKRTNGKVKVRHFAGATLTSPPQTYDSILTGVVDIG
ncbi:MAG: C4-dicarboxylate ABC transporter substrate-binding protein, partial [Deltaproteobacteria bacterium]